MLKSFILKCSWIICTLHASQFYALSTFLPSGHFLYTGNKNRMAKFAWNICSCLGENMDCWLRLCYKQSKHCNILQYIYSPTLPPAVHFPTLTIHHDLFAQLSSLEITHLKELLFENINQGKKNLKKVLEGSGCLRLSTHLQLTSP